MNTAFFKRVPWGKFLLLWFLSFLMGASLLWLHYGFTEQIWAPLSLLDTLTGLGLLWATTRPRWQKAYCSWCGMRVQAQTMKYDEARKGWVTLYPCVKCGQATEKFKKDI